MSKVTREEIMELFFPERKQQKPAPAAKPAAAKATERWAQKPTVVVIQEEADHNEAVIARLKAEAEVADFRRSEYQALIDRVWQNQLNYEASLRQFGGPSYHVGPGDPDWR